MAHISKRRNTIALVTELVLTAAICLGLGYNAFVSLSAESESFATEVTADYDMLTQNYLRAFKVLRMEAIEAIEQDLSFEEMQRWLQSRDADFADAVGADIYDGFAFTYKGGYAHSWDYGDYSAYVPASRPWYQTAQAAGGEVAFVAPYVTFLSNTDLIAQYDTLRMSVVQRYNDEISFDFDLTVEEINALLTNRHTIYDGTFAFMYDAEGYILSSTDAAYYGHNINTADGQVSQRLCDVLRESHKCGARLLLRHVNGSLRLIFAKTDAAGKTLCLLIPFTEFFARNLLFVLLLALLLICMEIVFFRRMEKHVTELEEGKSQLDSALQRAETASRAKGDFMSRMSHEIRTPLNAIIGYLSIARDERTENERIEHCLENGELAAKHLLSIINDVLDMSSIESGRIKIASESFNLKQQISTVATIFYNQAKNRHVDFQVKISDLTEEWVVGDQLRVNQIVMNLLSNAVKFTPENGHVVLSVHQLEKNDTAVIIQFQVSDTGVGMSEEFLCRMFTPFEQETAGTAQKYGGTGLGLSISKNLTSLMHGDMTVDSKQGEGATFTVTLPFGVSEKSVPLADGHKDFAKIRVMVVDDQENEQVYVKQLLKRLGVKADTFSDGETAVKRFVSRLNTDYAYDLCIIDWMMPDCDGLEVARQIREKGGPNIPIIIATAYDVTEVDAQAKISGVDKVIAKPLFQSTLLDLMIDTFGKYQPQGNAEIARTLNLQGMRILLAEDNEMNMEIAVSILSKAGIVLETATNGKEALDKFVAAAPGYFAAILMDVQMPVMNGYEATKAIRASAHPEAGTVPIIAMTANAFNEDVESALAAGMNGHIAKPVDYDKLYRTLSDCVGVGAAQTAAHE